MNVLTLAGLPGTGKSAIATQLARLGAHVLEKDRVRAALFGPNAVAYAKDQDDCVVEALHLALEHLTRAGFGRLVVLDGRTYARARDVEDLRRRLTRLAIEPRFVECRCDPAVARARLAADASSGAHLARDRTPQLYDAIAARAEPLPVERLLIDTTSATPRDACRAILARWPELARSLDLSAGAASFDEP